MSMSICVVPPSDGLPPVYLPALNQADEHRPAYKAFHDAFQGTQQSGLANHLVRAYVASLRLERPLIIRPSPIRDLARSIHRKFRRLVFVAFVLTFHLKLAANDLAAKSQPQSPQPSRK